MPNTTHRGLSNRQVIVVEQDGILAVDGTVDSPYLLISQQHKPFDDPVIAALSARFPHLRSLADGGVWEGLFTSIVSQAVSLQSASAFQRRLCAMYSPAIEHHGQEFIPLPTADHVAESSLEMVRSAGLTMRRAQGLIDVAREYRDGNVDLEYDRDTDAWMRELVKLPMVGPWTAASALLWGVGHPDVYPPGDVALLRAARLAYDDASMTMKDLAVIAECWRPQRAIAARLLWTHLLGMAWDD